MILQSIRLASLLGAAPAPSSRLGREIQRVVRDLFSAYRPERHYMRGPGPACLARRNGMQPAPVRVSR